MQKLIMPIDDAVCTAAYMNADYKKEWGFNHYGLDVVSNCGNRIIKSPGVCTVYACGWDGIGSKQKCGNAVVLVFKGVQCNNGKTCDMSIRLFHLQEIYVKTGDILYPGDAIGEYGNTGDYTSGAHLHVECDTDIATHKGEGARMSPSVTSNGNVILAGYADTMLDPINVFYLDEGQTYRARDTAFADEKDQHLPSLDTREILEAKIKELQDKLDEIKVLANKILDVIG